VDRAVDPAATEQPGVGRVHDDVDVDLGDVAADRAQEHVPTVGSGT
jgi:hypothetical protein